MTGRFFLLCASISGFLSVALGAFAAHGLKQRLDEYSLSVFQTGVSYQFYHSLALGLLGLVMLQMTHSLFKTSGIAFLFGICVFSGSLYILAISGQKWLGAITPFGGLAFLVGWILFGVAVFKARP